MLDHHCKEPKTPPQYTTLNRKIEFSAPAGQAKTRQKQLQMTKHRTKTVLQHLRHKWHKDTELHRLHLLLLFNTEGSRVSLENAQLTK